MTTLRIAVLATLGLSFPAFAEGHVDWAVFADDNGNRKQCWAVTAQEKGVASYLYVSKFPGRRQPEVSVSFDERPRSSVDMRLVIGRTTIRIDALPRSGQLFAWVSDSDQKLAISAITKADAAGVSITLMQGDDSLARFSAKGAGEMVDRAQAECR